MNADVIVIGAGTVGAAIAYGLASRNVSVLVLDGGDRDFRAAAANFGLVWQHGKGMGMPAYQKLTRSSVSMWPGFSAELADASGVDLQYEQRGGLVLCLSEADLEQRRGTLMRLHSQYDEAGPDWEMIGRNALQSLLPAAKLGEEITGASFGRDDGHANPLRLLTALHLGIVRKGGEIRGGASVHAISKDRNGDFLVAFGSERASAPAVVVAAGLGSQAIARQVGLDVPLHAQRGQILVTERLAPFLPLPTMNIRQTGEGTIMIGATNEDVGCDTSVTGRAATALSAGAIREIPALRDARLVRQWSGLRIMTPDGFPVYAQSQSHPGAFVALCHSGVTLAAAHAARLSEEIIAGQLSPFLDHFHQRRFDVQKAA